VKFEAFLQLFMGRGSYSLYLLRKINISTTQITFYASTSLTMFSIPSSKKLSNKCQQFKEGWCCDQSPNANINKLHVEEG
jgi:hypothetical protein